MLTVLIEMADDDAERLGLTLGCLVPASVEGLVREVVILDAGMGAAARHLAEHAGCHIRPRTEIGDAVAGARGEWLLLLEAGSELAPGWIDAVFRWLRAGSSDARGARFRPDRSTLTDLLPTGRSRRMSRGVLAPRTLLARSHRAGMRLGELAASVPTETIGATIRPAHRR